MKKIFSILKYSSRIMVRGRHMDVLFSGEEELKVRAMDGLKPKSFSQETKTRCQHRPEIVDAHLERVQDARRLFSSFSLLFFLRVI